MLTIRVRNKASHFIKCKRLLINLGHVLHIYDNDRIFTPPTWKEINEAVSQIWAERGLYQAVKKEELREGGEDEEVYDERETGVAHDVILDSPHQIRVKAEQE